MHTAARKSQFPAMASAVLPLQRCEWVPGSLRDAQHHCTTHIHVGSASADEAIFVVYLEYFMIHIHKEKHGSQKLICGSKNILQNSSFSIHTFWSSYIQTLPDGSGLDNLYLEYPHRYSNLPSQSCNYLAYGFALLVCWRTSHRSLVKLRIFTVS